MQSQIDLKLVLKLGVYSLIVGAVLYGLGVSPGDVYGTVFDALAWVWRWKAGVAVDYILLGATIVVPIYIISRLGKRLRGDR